ncbi:MAG: amidase [Bacilli bacterium]|nr:amidase [Bacilli bacterium]
MLFKRLLKITIFLMFFITLNVGAEYKSVIDITKMDIKQLNEALELKIITSEDLINIYLERIEAYDKNHNAIISINENAINEAKALDKERESGKPKSLLHGIPIIVKDNIDVLGLPTTAGSTALKDNFPKNNSFVVQKLIDAGAIILAKANMSEFSFQANSSISSYGTVKNAYNIAYSSYGSSGGAAVSVAANFAAAALGTDTNSSIRLPAAAANLDGLRPTVGIISRSGVLPYDLERDTIGTLTKTVTDSIILMNVINGYDKQDYKSFNEKQTTYETTFEDLEGITIGIPTDFIKGSSSNNLPENQEIYSELESLIKKAITNLEAKKAKIIYLEEYYNYQTDHWFNNSLSGYLLCDGINNYFKSTIGSIRTFQELNKSPEKITSLDSYIDSCDSDSTKINSKNMLKEEYKNYIDNIILKNNLDIIMYPTTKNKLLKYNNLSRTQNLSAHASSTINYPAIVLPLGFDSLGLPYGIEFMAPSKEEQLLLEVAKIFENINKNNITPSISPTLYEIPESVESLVKNYRKVYFKKTKTTTEKEWLKNVQHYLKGYPKNENFIEESESLNLEYVLQKKEIIKQKNYNMIFKYTLTLIFVAFFVIMNKKVIISTQK